MSSYTGIAIEAYALSDAGCVRPRNEDSYLMADLTLGIRDPDPRLRRHVQGVRGSMFVVCDGMGGAAAGELASSLAVEIVHQEMLAAPAWGLDRAILARLLRRAIRAANCRLLEMSSADRRLHGMGTTLSAAVTCGDALVIAQIGDSRAYLCRSDSLVQVTRDQSVVAALVQAGRLSPDEARMSGQSNVILQALGIGEDVDVSISIAELRRGDRLLLCTDGLHGPLPESVIREVVSGPGSLEAVCHELVDRTKILGTPDNVTVVLVRFGGDGLHDARGADDLPRFVEFDPAEEGEHSITSTSRVARRLAVRIGIGLEPEPPTLPATSQYHVVIPR
ncbi:MAG: protein phosphatase 2C domain-containing protein, partial [Pseudomonadota bacterium]